MHPIVFVTARDSLEELLRLPLRKAGFSLISVPPEGIQAAARDNAAKIALIDSQMVKKCSRAITETGLAAIAITEEENVESLAHDVIDEFVVFPVRPLELVVRLEAVLKIRADDVNQRDAPTTLASFRRYADLFASAAQGIVVFRRRGEVLFANPRAYEIMGHRDDTVIRDKVWNYVHFNDRSILPDLSMRFARNEFPRAIDIQCVRRDGESIITNCSFASMVDAESTIVIAFQDVTEQRRTEEELVKTMEFLESLIDASVDGIVATDMQGELILFNPSAERIYEHKAEDVIGELTIKDLFRTSDAQSLLDRLISSAGKDRSYIDPLQVEAISATGESIPIQLSASTMYANNEPSAIVLIFTDLRDKVRAERRLAEAQKQLEFKERQAVLAELAGTAAHELNQPLTSMMAYAELLQRKAEPGSIALKAADVLITEAERMAEIVRKIGRITRYETTAYVGTQKIFDLDRASRLSPDKNQPGDE